MGSFIAKLLTEDQYGKLCFIIGKGLDKAIVQAKGKLEGRNTLYEIITKSENSKAQRFDTIYRNDGDDTSDSKGLIDPCLLYTSPSPRDLSTSRMPSSA